MKREVKINTFVILVILLLDQFQYRFVSAGLFHRAILMSGTALSDWAITKNPLKYTIQVAQAVNCPLVERGDELAFCLRKKRLSELMSVSVQAPQFSTPFGPVVDGSVVPNEPHLLMGVYKELFSR
jgi:neuroligin